ncbi:hypothetical protein LXL04_013346 [Taraxacum kok-saghyz]
MVFTSQQPLLNRTSFFTIYMGVVITSPFIIKLCHMFSFLTKLQGPIIQILSIDKLLEGITSFYSLIDHRERITSMRLFPLKETTILRDKTEVNDNVLVTSSCDNSIRIWWRGSCQRLFRGHKGAVTILSDKLLGDGSGKVFASGGEDTTVRIWSLSSRKKRDPHALKATLYGHEKPLVFMAVTGHNSSLLTTMSTDSMVRVWDTTVSSDHSSCCVGMTSVHGAPVGIKCHDSLVYIASGSSFEAVDLRTMKTAFKTSTNQANLFSFEIMPAKFLACTGGLGRPGPEGLRVHLADAYVRFLPWMFSVHLVDAFKSYGPQNQRTGPDFLFGWTRAMLWDIRRSSGTGDAGQVAELDGHVDPMTHLHMDSYKILTGGPEDPWVNIWDADTGNWMNSLKCWNLDGGGCCGMAVNGFRIVTAGYNEEECVLTFRYFNNAVSFGSLSENVIG